MELEIHKNLNKNLSNFSKTGDTILIDQKNKTDYYLKKLI